MVSINLNFLVYLLFEEKVTNLPHRQTGSTNFHELIVQLNLLSFMATVNLDFLFHAFKEWFYLNK